MSSFILRDLGIQDYEPVWRQMQQFTEDRTVDTADEIWCLQHNRVFTLGLNGDRSHVLAPGEIPVIGADRGGHVTYHGPGQLIMYFLLDLKRLGLGIRQLVEFLEQAIIDTVAVYGVQAHGRRDAPGVYVDAGKLAALGLRVRRGCTYHGIALNVAMDLEPFSRINPCGMPELSVTQLSDLCSIDSLDIVSADLLGILKPRLAGYLRSAASKP